MAYTANFEYECCRKVLGHSWPTTLLKMRLSNLKDVISLKKFVGAYNNDITITLENWVNESLPKDYKGDLLLQMDIEGAVYETLIYTPVHILQLFRNYCVRIS